MLDWLVQAYEGMARLDESIDKALQLRWTLIGSWRQLDEGFHL